MQSSHGAQAAPANDFYSIVRRTRMVDAFCKLYGIINGMEDGSRMLRLKVVIDVLKVIAQSILQFNMKALPDLERWKSPIFPCLLDLAELKHKTFLARLRGIPNHLIVNSHVTGRDAPRTNADVRGAKLSRQG